VDESTIGNVGIELENDPSGLWWTLVLVPGSQKVRGSNPLGSTTSKPRCALRWEESGRTLYLHGH
jgi:hypothetical protein